MNKMIADCYQNQQNWIFHIKHFSRIKQNVFGNIKPSKIGSENTNQIVISMQGH